MVLTGSIPCFTTEMILGERLMTKLNSVEVLDKRNELVEYGFTVVPEVMPESLVNQLRIWSDDILNHVTIDRKIRYQGS